MIKETENSEKRLLWLKITLRYFWYLLLLVMIVILFQGPERGFRYLGL